MACASACEGQNNGFKDVRCAKGPSQGQNLALTGLFVPSWLDSGHSQAVRPGKRESVALSLAFPSPLCLSLSLALTDTHTQTHTNAHSLSLSLSHTHALSHLLSFSLSPSHTHTISLSLSHTQTAPCPPFKSDQPRPTESAPKTLYMYHETETLHSINPQLSTLSQGKQWYTSGASVSRKRREGLWGILKRGGGVGSGKVTGRTTPYSAFLELTGYSQVDVLSLR